jgi:hypothetical protein
MNLTSEDCGEGPLLLARPRARTISRPAKRPGNDQKKARLISLRFYVHNLQLQQGSLNLTYFRDHRIARRFLKQPLLELRPNAIRVGAMSDKVVGAGSQSARQSTS